MEIKKCIFPLILFYSLSLYSQNTSNDFYIIDNHADNAPGYLKNSIPELVDYLVEPAQNDIQKVRAIFRWITQNIYYDVEAFFARRLISENPACVIERGKAVCGGYAQLFKHMCTDAGIESEIISGWSKGYAEPLSKQPNHAWNAVQISNQWHLLDVTWGAGYINNQQTYVKNFQEHYFFTEPGLFIYDHLPEDKKWQLLESPFSKREFEDMILLRPGFFKTGLSLLSHKESNIIVSEELVIKVAAPVTTYINAELIKNNQVLPDHYVFSQRMDSIYFINVHFPDKGKYILRIYSKAGNEQKLYYWACDYKIDVLKNENSNPFSRQFSSFYDLESYLFYPMDLFLKSDENQSFKIQVKDALEVSLLINEKTIVPLKRTNNVYSINIKPAGGPLRIMAKTDTTDQYQFLLEYQVK